MTSLDAELERHKEIIRGLFDDMCKYAMSSWNESLVPDPSTLGDD